MEYKSFIDELSLNNANYNNPEQAITTANLCDTISRDINTDSQRFVYELLQNADDASNRTGVLDVRIDFVGDFVIVSHKGESFSKVDIESISSAGDGTKTGDSNKTGFKGIGFKSVFSHSSLVIIKSGNFCFKFDKQHWTNHWSNTWSSQGDWKGERKAKNKDENLKMPWQIIPIWTELPNELKSLSFFQEYTVSTIIRYDKLEHLKKALTDLFSKSQIVLFLRSRDIKVSINTSEKIVLEKVVTGEVTTLKRNGHTLSEWLIKTDQFPIPPDVQNEINADDKSPKKLKEAKQTEISFAIQLEKGKLKAVETENRLIFTYLPTKVKEFEFPFLVNGSFLTDAGREKLHEDTFWNNWLFKQIPIKFFSWVAELAHKNSKYNKQFLAVVPHRLGGSLLESSFNAGFKVALETIAFVPNLKGDLLKVNETVFDKTNISEFINPQTVINYINESKRKFFSISSFTPLLEPLRTLSMLGTEMFDIDALEGFFTSSTFVKEHKLNENFSLISFLHEQAQRSKGDDGRNVWNDILRQTPFIFDESEKLKKPSHIYFPAVEFSNEFSDDISIIHDSIVSKINVNSRIKTWLEYLGVKEPSDLSFIEKTIIEQGDTFVTKANAIEVGRYLFNTHKKGVLQEKHYDKLQNLKVFTKKNSLILATKSFLSDFYEPDLRIEGVYDNDIFVSEKYFESKDLKSEWKTFLIKIGVVQGIKWQKKTIQRSELQSKYSRYFQLIPSGSPYNGFTNDFFEYELNQISLIEYATDYSFSKHFWQYIFQLGLDGKSSGYDVGVHYFGYLGNRSIVLPVVFNTWFLENAYIIPTTQKTCLKASDVYSTAIPQIFDVAGKYLPVFDYEGAVPPEWQAHLKFIPTLGLNAYLQILGSIWRENSQDKNLQKENQKRIGLIYEKLALINFHTSERENIKEWANSNKLLAKNGTDFYFPKDLSIVTVDGFRASHLAFAEKQSPEIIELLRLLGVQIIDKVNATISNSKVEITALKAKLLQTSPLIALVAVEKSNNKREWENEYERITKKLSTIHFFETTEIYLSYGNADDRQKRSSWAENDNFYYVGEWYNARVLDGLIEPLGNFLKIKYAERILTVLLLETFAGGIEYLKEKGFDLSLIPDNMLNSPENEVILPSTNGNTSPDAENFLRDLGRKGEKFVYEELKRIYSNKYGHPILETETGFRVGSSVEVFWRNISENTTTNHDFKVVDLKKEIYIDSKATTYGKNVEKLALYISGNELNLMENADKYLIARVYNVASENPTVEFVRLEIEAMV